MAVAKDPAIKLFGKTISLPDAQFSDESESVDNGSCLVTKAETDECKNENSGIMDEAASLECCKGKQPPTSKAKTHQEESHGSGEPKPPFKRPDKVLPCPRCNSLDTKFCYFNNYNVNQPRYFCKNCQRYWTAGGTVRNVPVGAGRRRNKHLASQYRQIIASSDGPTTLIETPESGNHQILSCEESSSSCATSSPNEMVLKFGPESPQCDSMPTILSQRLRNGCSDQASLPSGSSLPASFGARAINNEFPLQPSLYHYAVPQIATLRPNSSTTMPMAVPGLQLVPASYWNCIPVLVAGSGNVSLALPNGCASPLFSNGSGLQVLGKHSRDSNTTNEETSKALRIHDLDEA